MSFELFGWLVLQLFIPVVATATAFLVCFNVVLALIEQVHVITNSEERR